MQEKMIKLSHIITDCYFDRNEAIKRDNVTALEKADDELREKASELSKLIVESKNSELLEFANDILKRLKKMDDYLKKDNIDSFMKEDEAIRKIALNIVDTILDNIKQ